MSVGDRMSSKKQRHNGKPIEREILQPKVARVTDYTAPPCSCCERLRLEDSSVQGRNCTRVVSTVGKIRYLKCSFCGNTWKDHG